MIMLTVQPTSWIQRIVFGIMSYEKKRDVWFCEKDGFLFRADNPVELLGLAAIRQSLKPKENTEYWWQISEPNILSELDPES